MSGILGLVMLDGSPVERDLLARLTACQRFRGPDGEGVWADGPAGLGHTLFRTLEDVEGGGPLSTPDGALCISADARIDDQRRLRAELARLGRPCPADAPDALLLLHAYAVWGDDCLGHVLGDYTFALWDRARRRLFCAVDPFRIKPFFYAVTGRAFIGANTLDAVRAHPDVSDRLDDTAIGDYLAFGHYRAADLTAFADVCRLPPAHCLIVEGGRVRLRRYWSPPAARELPDQDPVALQANFLEKLDEALRDRLRVRRVVLPLSGGLDSPLLAWRLVRFLRAGAPIEVRAFTAVFDRLIPDRERHYAARAADALGLRTEFVSADDFSLFDWVETCEYVPPEPLEMLGWDWTLRNARRLAAAGRVALTGLDGDTLLKADLPAHWGALWRAGRYGRLVGDMAWYVWTRKRPPPLGLRDRLRRGRARPCPALPAWVNAEFARRSGLEERWRDAHRPPPRPESGRAVVWDYLTAPMLSSVYDAFDPGWTGLPLESRHPLMDMRVLEFLAHLPSIPWCVQKEFFRACLRNVLPREVLNRPKSVLAGDPLRAKFSQQRERWEKIFFPGPEAAYFVDTAMLKMLQSLSIGLGNSECFLPYGLSFWLKLQQTKVVHHATP